MRGQKNIKKFQQAFAASIFTVDHPLFIRPTSKRPEIVTDFLLIETKFHKHFCLSFPYQSNTKNAANTTIQFEKL